MGWFLSIDRSDIGSASLVETAARELAPDEVRITIRRFALTANNITYAAFGDVMGYWAFFPAPEEGRGFLPVWGFGEVTESLAEGIEEGELIYGYFPAGSELIVKPQRLTRSGFVDASTHRETLPRVYNRYNRCAGDPGYDPTREAEHMILQPLFITAFLIDAYLRDQDCFGAGIVSLTSASSKTALGLAWMLSQDKPGNVQIEALTSPGNTGFIHTTGLYDRVVSYDEIDTLKPDPPRVIVDFAGSADLNRRLHNRLQSTLTRNIRVGGAHWDDSAPVRDLPGPKPEFFFAPDHVLQRSKDWGTESFTRRHGEAFQGFAAAASDWLDYRNHEGPEACLDTYLSLTAGKVDPKTGLIIQVG